MCLQHDTSFVEYPYHQIGIRLGIYLVEQYLHKMSFQEGRDLLVEYKGANVS